MIAGSYYFITELLPRRPIKSLAFQVSNGHLRRLLICSWGTQDTSRAAITEK